MHKPSAQQQYLIDRLTRPLLIFSRHKLAGAGLLYYFVAANKSSAEFLIATDGEMRKVNWSSRKDVLGSTWVVIGASVLLAICLLVVDVAFATFFRSINVLDG